MLLDTVYVTVGTTKFDALIHEITSDKALAILKSHGCTRLILQLGSGDKVDAEKIHSCYGIAVEQYDFKFEPVRADILAANLVIGHAGAGTCMDILNNKKPGLIVVNETLMNNHQVELAMELADRCYLYYCDVAHLCQNLDSLDFGALKPYNENPCMDEFVAYLNNMMNS